MNHVKRRSLKIESLESRQLLTSLGDLTAAPDVSDPVEQQLKIIPRAVELVDYTDTAGGADP